MENYPYVVFSVSAEGKRTDWYMVPEVAQAHKTLREKVAQGAPQAVADAMSAFRLVTLTSPDLLLRDAHRIVAKVEEDVKAIGSTFTAGGALQQIPELKEIAL